MTLEQLRNALVQGQHPKAEIISIDGMIYLVHIDGEPIDDGTVPLQFRSSHAAGRTLHELGLREGWLIHQCPYDEMIGRGDTAPPAPLRLPMRFSPV